MPNGFYFLIAFIAIAAASLLWNYFQSGKVWCCPMPEPYCDRESQDALWRQRIPDGEMETTDLVLQFFCNSFAFNPEDRFKLVPDDRVMDVYRACYPPRKFWQADCMEIEGFMIQLDKEFGIEVADFHPQITLGEIVDLAHKRGAAGGHA